MDKIQSFITQAREKGLEDTSIRESLTAQGWDKAAIDIALVGLDVPKPEMSVPAPTKASAEPPHAPSLNPLMAALHHVILWFFIGSSSVSIGGTIASLYGMEVSSEALASMMAVTLITFIPYAVLFGLFLRGTRKTPLLIPGKVWSIITICLNSIGAMIAAIVAVVNLITGGEPVFLIAAALILLLDLLVVITYSFAAFGTHRALKLRTVVMSLYLPLLVVMFGILFMMSFLKLGPAKHDETLRKDLSTVVEKVSAQTRDQKKLPDSITSPSSNASIKYKKLTDKTYQVCAEFATTNKMYARDDIYNNTAPSDAYVSESTFYASHTGENCFEFTSEYLTQQTPDLDLPYDAY
jgi:hypothetical protein